MYQRPSRPTWAAIARAVGVTRRTVRRWVENWKASDSVEPRKRVRAHKLSAEHVALAEDLLKQPETNTSSRAAQQLAAAPGGVRVSSRTLRRELKAAGVTYRDPPRQCLRTTKQKLARVQWARKHSKQSWRAVLFTDSKYFHMHPPRGNRACKAWGRSGQRQPLCIVKHPQAVHAYAGVSFYGTTKLYFATGTAGLKSKYFNRSGQKFSGVGAQEYADVLHNTLLPDGDKLFASSGVWASKWVLQQDGAAAHTAKDIRSLLAERMPGRVLDWPANSPDLSWIENIWGWMEKELRRRPYCSNIEDFKVTLQSVWKTVPKSMLERSVNGMPKRLVKCIELDGEGIGK